MTTPTLAIALMALGRDAATLAATLPAVRTALAPVGQVALVALLDEATPEQIGAVLPHADVIGASAFRTGFAHARRRALHTALSLRPDGVLVCDGDGLFPPASIVAIARAWLDSPVSVVVPQREGHTLPAPAGLESESRVALEALENAAGALLIRRPDLAGRDLQPGAFVLPAEVAQQMLTDVTSEDFAWDLECTLAVARLPTRRLLGPTVAAAPQAHTTFAPEDLASKVRMLARYHGRARVLEVLASLRDGAHAVPAPAALLERLIAALA